jgi:undecaprenyl-diphosphatase
VFDIARGHTEGDTTAGVIAAGVVTSFIVGFAAIAFLIPYLRTNRLNLFAAYRVVLGVIVLGLVAAGTL